MAICSLIGFSSKALVSFKSFCSKTLLQLSYFWLQIKINKLLLIKLYLTLTTVEIHVAIFTLGDVEPKDDYIVVLQFLFQMFCYEMIFQQVFRFYKTYQC